MQCPSQQCVIERTENDKNGDRRVAVGNARRVQREGNKRVFEGCEVGLETRSGGSYEDAIYRAGVIYGDAIYNADIAYLRPIVLGHVV